MMATSSFSFGGRKMNEKRQMSDTIRIGIVLAIVGGFLDAYTYLCRGQVFANAQTGNMVLLGIQFMNQEFLQALFYLLPIIAFLIGILIAEMIKHHFGNHPKIHWRQIVLCVELLVLSMIIFIPQNYNMICNIMISFVCSLQVESFRKFHGVPYASTMCTGNLRSATENLYLYFHTKDKKTLQRSLEYYMIILFFILGACLGVFFTNIFDIKALFVPILLLIVVTIFMFIEQVG